MRSAGIRSSTDTLGEVNSGVNYDKVFVPQYESYHAQRVPGNGGVANPPTPALCNRSNFCSASGMRAGLVEKGGRSSALLLPPSTSSPRSGLQGVLHGNAQTPHPPWPVLVSANASSSASAVDSVRIGSQQFQQSWSGMYRKLSEFQIALRASEKAREDGEKETQAFRVYVSNVETAAAGLVARVQDLENLLALSTTFRQGLDAEQLRGKVATEALKEAQKQATAAAQSIAVAREATMELDKVKRETNAWAVAQEAEIERLNMEAAECRMLCEASSKMIQDLRIQIANLQRQLEHQNATIEDSQKTLQIEAGAYQKKYEEAKFAVIEKADQCDELMQALELSTAVGKAAELKLEELLAERKDMTQKNEFLEHQVKELKSQDHGAAAVQYDQELRRARNALEDEKAQLLDDLAQLRRSNQNWTDEMKANWHEKQRSASTNYSSSDDPLQQHPTLSQQTSDALLIAAASKPGVLRSKVEPHTHASTSPSKGSCSYNYSQEEVERGRLSVASSASASGSWRTETSGMKDCNNHRPDVTWSQSSSSNCSSSKEARRQSHCGTTTGTCGKLPDARSQFQSSDAASSEALESSGDENTGATLLAFKELTLLAAAQHEIMKLKEINEQLVAACQ